MLAFWGDRLLISSGFAGLKHGFCPSSLKLGSRAVCMVRVQLDLCCDRQTGTCIEIISRTEFIVIVTYSLGLKSGGSDRERAACQRG